MFKSSRIITSKIGNLLPKQMLGEADDRVAQNGLTFQQKGQSATNDRPPEGACLIFRVEQRFT